jgi:Mycothiol maleylpyruvate isomerase N-terminal domain
MPGSVGASIAAVQRTQTRVTQLLRSGLDGTRQVTGLSWSIRDLAAHLASGSAAYRQMAEGEPSPYDSVDGRGETNKARIEAEDTQDLNLMADQIDVEIARMLVAVGTRAGDVVSWHGGKSIPVTAFLGSVVGEFIFHGCDLARTLGHKWPIDRQDALPVVDFLIAVTPVFVDSQASCDFKATYELRFRGYDTATFAFDHGTLVVSQGPTIRPDIRMSVDPAAFLGVAYKRSGLAIPILTGRAVAWGRRPWLALKFPGLFQAP